jgi:probable O-glycosylation ligase (exosortase A-associated)
MRDIVLTIAIFGALPFILARPYFGVLVWTWLAYFNPNRYVWSFATQLPFSQLVGGATLLAWLFNSNEPKAPPRCAATYLWIAFVVWMVLTTLFAQQGDAAIVQAEKVFKIQIFALFMVIVTTTWQRVRALIWCIVLSLGFFGTKGGAWVIATAGSGRVWGPPGTFIEGNNELALALLMTIPLMYFLYATETRRWLRRALVVAMVLVAFSVAGSYSRGALLASAAMVVFVLWRSRRNMITVTALVALLGFGITSVMPETWFERAESIRNYEEDQSAQKRLNTWTFAWNFSKDYPVTGGGFEIFGSAEAYVKYAPRSDEGWIFQDAHNIYLKVLAEHGFVGLGLFLMFFGAAWRRASRVRQSMNKHSPKSLESQAALLAGMLQTSLVAYAVGGTFLGLSYFDLPYNVAGLCIVLSTTVLKPSSVTQAHGIVPNAAGRAAVAPSTIEPTSSVRTSMRSTAKGKNGF